MCRHWRQLVQSEALLQTVELSFGGRSLLPRLRSFREWVLACASQHLQRLNLNIVMKSNEAAEESAALLAAALAACGASGSLRELQLEMNKSHPPLFYASWLAALRSLRRLSIVIAGDLSVTASLVPLAALEVLGLDGSILTLPPSARLPASLTQLRLAGVMRSGSLPSQVWPHMRACMQ